MIRTTLLRGVSAGALTLVCVSPCAQSFAQEALPTIEIGASRAPERTTGPAPGGEDTSKGSLWSPTLADGKPAFVEKWQLPNPVSSVTRKEIERTINIVNPEDSVKYLPSLFVRKRNIGDTQATLQTRTWGVGSSARSLVYADDLLLTALIGNDNTIGAPRWGLVSPEEIERVDFLYGPYAAQYSGNSMGGVLKITTRMPDKLEVTAKNTTAIQDFSLYGTSAGLVTNITNIFVGDRINDFSWTVSGNWQRGSQQPLTYVNASGTNLYGYPGAYFATNRFGVPATVLGATGNLANDQVNGKLKLAYDVTPTIRATYTLGFWSNDGTSYPQNYLAANYAPFFGRAFTPSPPWPGQSVAQNFASGYYRIQEKMLTNAGAIRSNTGGLFDFEISASNFTYLQSDQRQPFSGAIPYGGYTATGRNQIFTGTYWTLFDAKGIVRPEGLLKDHDISFGLHGDHFNLNNPTYLTTWWPAGQNAAIPGVAQSISQGSTRTQALWVQDAFKIDPKLKLTVGVRGEHWTGSNGYNQSLGSLNAVGLGSTASRASLLPVFQPVKNNTRFSPKGSLQWTPDDIWTITGSIGMANRFPTARELYSLTTTPGPTGVLANPNPNLTPEVALTKEVAFERMIGTDGTGRVTLFDEEVRDAIISQSTFVPGTTQLVNTPVNVQRVRNSGVEVAFSKQNVLFKGLELTGSATWLNARIVSNPTWAPTVTLGNFSPSNPGNLDFWALSVAGKNVPNVPNWRGTVAATYSPDDHWAFTVAMRYQGRMWSTLTNNDFTRGVYAAFDPFFVVDTKIHYKLNDRFSFDFGVDNINNYKYFLFHPFPQRTFYVAGKYEFGENKGAPGIFFTGNEGFMPDFARWFRPSDTKWF